MFGPSRRYGLLIVSRVLACALRSLPSLNMESIASTLACTSAGGVLPSAK